MTQHIKNKEEYWKQIDEDFPVMDFSKVQITHVKNLLDLRIELVLKACVPNEKEFPGWNSAQSVEDFVGLTERYAWNEARVEILKKAKELGYNIENDEN